jgi:hypothetical protein
MPRPATQNQEPATGQWIIRDVPVEVMARIRAAAALQRTSVKQLILDLAIEYLRGFERQNPLSLGQKHSAERSRKKRQSS